MTGIRPVAYGSPEYEATIELRRAVLRLPLGLDFTPEGLAAERDDIHLAVIEDGIVIGCLVLTLHDATTLQMRQVAVHPDRQGQGIGRQLVETSEALAALKGFQEIILHAREKAVPFYVALGYAVEGEPFEEIGIPHRAMSKNL